MDTAAQKGRLFSPELTREVRSKFHHMDADPLRPGRRIYFDNAGGAFRLRAALDAFHGLDAMPDCPERVHQTALYMNEVMDKAEDDIRTIFNARRGGKIITMLGSGTQDAEEVEWMVETGEIGITSPDMKYISRLTVRMSMDIGSEVRFYAQYDLMDNWEDICVLEGTSLRSFSIPIRPRRCDHMKLRIEGVGNAKIYSITKIIEQGSELS